jgi:hypothetical protein
MADQTGLQAALGARVAAAEIPGADAEQLDLMDPVAQLPLLGDVVIDGKRTTPGRPKGAMNKATKELADYVLSHHRHPVIAAAQICDMPLAVLRDALRCDMLDAAKYQQSCREFVARYTLQAMPQSVQVDMGTVGKLFVVNLNAPRAGETGEANPFALDLVPVEQNQSLSADEKAASHE